MMAVVDTSTLISLAWSGQLKLLAMTPIELLVPDVVRDEAVTAGIAGGYADAAAIETAIGPLASVATRPAENIDNAVLATAIDVGMLMSNDLALGRRAANLGARWLRTADLILACTRTGSVSAEDGRAALSALHAAGRVSPALLASYLEEII